MGTEWWIQKLWEGGGYCAILELPAILWLLRDRASLIADVKAERLKSDNLAERLLVVATELKLFLFNERRA